MTELTTKFPKLISNKKITISQVITNAASNGFTTRGTNESIIQQKADTVEEMKTIGGEELPKNLPQINEQTKTELNIYEIVKNNINARKEHNAESYYFFNDIVGIIVALFMGGVTAVLMLYISFQVAQRFISLLFKILLTPYAVSGLIDPNDNGTSVWFKLCIADILGNFFQMLFLWLSLMATVWFDKAGLVKAVFFIACLMGILNAPQGVAQLLGSDIGASSGMQGIRQAMQFGGMALAGMKTVKSGLKMAKKVGHGMGSASAIGTYGVARAMGLDRSQIGNLAPKDDGVSGGGSGSSSDDSGSSSSSSNISSTGSSSSSSLNNAEALGEASLLSGSDGSASGSEDSSSSSSSATPMSSLWKDGSRGQRISNRFNNSHLGQSKVGGMVRKIVNRQIKNGHDILHGQSKKQEQKKALERAKKSIAYLEKDLLK